jgi:hypothetical protein
MQIGKLKKQENIHILFWLIKDFCWSLEIKWMAMFMILPTVTLAIIIFWNSRFIVSEAYHNFAVCFWILANSIWMIGEFSNSDFRFIAAILFFTGLFILLFYYAKSFLLKFKNIN